MPHPILIQNTGEYRSLNRARRLVAKGKAHWADECHTAIVYHDQEWRRSNTGPLWPAELPVTVRAKWLACYRNTEAPVIAVTPEWLRSVGY